MNVRKAWFSRSYRWVYLWLGVGALLSLLLLTNSVRDYRFVARLLATQQVRHQMRQDLTGLEQKLRQSRPATLSRLTVLQAELKSSGTRPLWIQIRAMDGPVLEQYGDPSLHVFSDEEEQTGFQSHEAVFRVLDLADGTAVVEAFPMHDPTLDHEISSSATAPEASPPATSPSTARPAGARVPRSFVLVELAVPLTAADPRLLRMQKWNLFLNCSGALALLGAVIVAGVNVRSYVKGRLLEAQVDLAREVQARLLPVGSGDFGLIRTATEYQPADQVGGDFYDVFRVGETTVAIVIGDVSGKGLPAALLMGVIHGAVRASGWTSSRAEHEAETAKLNSLICEHAEGNRYATMFWCYFDQTRGELRYINAGHAPPLLVKPRPEGVLVERLEGGGPVVGLLPGASFEQAHCAVHAGDLLVMCSDGLLEAMRQDGEEFGEARLEQVLRKVSVGSAPQQVRAEVMDALLAFMAEARPHDDLTLVIAQFC